MKARKVKGIPIDSHGMLPFFFGTLDITEYYCNPPPARHEMSDSFWGALDHGWMLLVSPICLASNDING